MMFNNSTLFITINIFLREFEYVPLDQYWYNKILVLFAKFKNRRTFFVFFCAFQMQSMGSNSHLNACTASETRLFFCPAYINNFL